MKWRVPLRAVVFGLAIAIAGLPVAQAAFAQCVLPNNLLNGTVADAPQMMANFNALVACLTPGGSTNALQYNGGAGVPAGLGPLTNGQLVIGSTGNSPQAQSLTAGAGVSVVGAAGSVTLSATNATANTGLYRQVMSPTPTSASTGLGSWLNQGTSVALDSAVGLIVDAPPVGSGLNLVGRFKGAPTPPYTIKALIGMTTNSNSAGGIGLGWYDGTAKLHFLGLNTQSGGPTAFGVSKWNSATSANGADYQSPTNAFAQPIWLQIQDDGTNVSFAFSQDGANFLPLFSVAKVSGFLGASGYNNIVFLVDPRGTSHTLGTLMSLTQN